MTIDEIKGILASGALSPRTDDVIATCQLASTTSDTLIEGRLHLGWDIAKAWECDKSWGTFNIQLAKFIEAQNYTPAELGAVLDSIQIDDSHWRWFDKACSYTSTEYLWFFLTAEQYPQGACLLFHPKKSAFGPGNIFYVEYVAVAPWNRNNPMSSRAIRGVGSALIRGAAAYAVNKLGLHPGFSLHAIPRASDFYKSIGMTPHPVLDKPPMPYFEMTEQSFHTFMGNS